MKRLFLIVMILFSIPTFAGDGGRYIFFGTGYQWSMIDWERRFLNFNIGFEFEKKHHNAWEIYVDVTSKYKNCKSCNPTNYRTYDYNSFGVGVAYKSVILRGKNTNLRWKAGADIGSNVDKRFQASIDLGLEFSYTFKNNMQVYVLQKNDIVFWNNNLFQNGLLFGLKIPLN